MTRKYKMLQNALLPKVIWPCGQLPSFLSFPRISKHELPVYLPSFNLLSQFVQFQIILCL